MAFEESIRGLREFDINDLDLDNVGAWPALIKFLIWVLLLAAVLAGGYYYHIKDLQTQLAKVQTDEVNLKKDFEKKAFQAANLDAYKRQMEEMQESFGALVSQLPSDTEVPGLLEDITNKGLLNGLEIATIDLLQEQSKEFYIELPISIVATGTYHDLGAFISGMAGLPRIVTLHDFGISAGGHKNGLLHLNLVAKTYRYKDGEGEDL